MTQYARKILGAIDTLILNSGMLNTLPFLDSIQNENDEREMFDIIESIFRSNVMGHIYITSCLLKDLIQTKGRIVVISSVAAKIPAPTRTLYASSKVNVSFSLSFLFFSPSRLLIFRFV